MYYTSPTLSAPVLRQFKQRLPAQKRCLVAGDTLDIETNYDLDEKRPMGEYYFAKDSYFDTRVSIRVIRDAFADKESCRRSLLEITLRRHMQTYKGLEGAGVHGLEGIMPPPRVGIWKDIYLVCPRFDTDIQKVIQSRQVLTTHYIRYWAFLLLQGVGNMHAAGVLHQDLRPSNLLITSNDDFWIAGFSNATLVGAPVTDTCEQSPTRRYMYTAPELLLPTMQPTPAADIWSAGCVLAELLNRTPLFKDVADDQEHVEQIFKLLGTPLEKELERFTSHPTLHDHMCALPHHEPSLSVSTFPGLGQQTPTEVAMFDLLRKMLVFDPNARISAAEALEHELLRCFGEDEDEDDQGVMPKLAFMGAKGVYGLSIAQLRALLRHEVRAFYAGAVPVPPVSR
jgi:serine/threonine protein kinase